MKRVIILASVITSAVWVAMTAVLLMIAVPAVVDAQVATNGVFTMPLTSDI